MMHNLLQVLTKDNQIIWENTNKIFCHVCGIDISIPIDQYGTLNTPMCQRDFLLAEDIKHTQTKEEIEKKIKSLDDEIYWNDRTISDIEDENETLYNEIKEFEKELKNQKPIVKQLIYEVD